MAQNGFRNNPGAVNPDDDQELSFIPAQPQGNPTADRKQKMPSPFRQATIGFLKSHWGKTIFGTFVGISLMQSQIENPEHSTFSWEGAKNGAARSRDNFVWMLSKGWSIATDTAKPALKTANLVNSGTQPATYFIVCMNQDLEQKLADREPRARAFVKVVQTQLDNEAARLAFQNAAFYNKNANYDVGNGAPVAVFHIEDVPPSWSPSTPYVLEGPVPYEQKAAQRPGAGCGPEEIRKISPIPGVGGLN